MVVQGQTTPSKCLGSTEDEQLKQSLDIWWLLRQGVPSGRKLDLPGFN